MIVDFLNDRYSGPLSGYYIGLLLLSKRFPPKLLHKHEYGLLASADNMGEFCFVGIPAGYHLKANDTCLHEQLRVWNAPPKAIRNVDHNCIEIDDDGVLWVYYTPCDME